MLFRIEGISVITALVRIFIKRNTTKNVMTTISFILFLFLFYWTLYDFTILLLLLLLVTF